MLDKPRISSNSREFRYYIIYEQIIPNITFFLFCCFQTVEFLSEIIFLRSQNTRTTFLSYGHKIINSYYSICSF